MRESAKIQEIEIGIEGLQGVTETHDQGLTIEIEIAALGIGKEKGETQDLVQEKKKIHLKE